MIALKDIFSKKNRPCRVSELPHAVCKVKVGKEAGLHEGHGVFIAPDLLLTSWHILKASRPGSIIVRNDLGEMALLKTRGLKHKSEPLDLAVCELDAPIGYKFCALPKENSFPQKLKIYSRFNQEAEVNDAWPDSMENKEDLNRNLIKFRSTLFAKPGYSGSPLIDETGAVISLVCGVIGSDQLKAVSQWQNDKTVGIPFFAPNPRRVSAFLKEAVQAPR
jgi:hypothetical protein